MSWKEMGHLLKPIRLETDFFRERGAGCQIKCLLSVALAIADFVNPFGSREQGPRPSFVWALTPFAQRASHYSRQIIVIIFSTHDADSGHRWCPLTRSSSL